MISQLEFVKLLDSTQTHSNGPQIGHTLKKYSLHVELRAHWNKVSKVLMALGEIGQRANMFPILLNFFDKCPVEAQNYQTARKILDAARDFKFEILKYTTEFSASKTIEEIHIKVLKFSGNAPEPFENLKYQFSISQILTIVMFDTFSVENVIFLEIVKTIHGPIGSSCINQNYVQMAK